MTTSKVLTVQSVDRALIILEKLKENPGGLGVTDLSKGLAVSKSTAHRLLMSLNTANYVKQDPASGKYLLGLKFLEFGDLVSSNLDIRKQSSPFLKELASKTAETVHLVVREDNEVVYIDKIESPATIRMYSRVGKRASMYCTAVGKAFLAHLTEETVMNILIQKPMIEFTKKTITDKAELMLHLQTIRRNGYALDDEEHEEGVKCVAAPIIDHNGDIIAAVSVAAPSMRVDNKKLDLMKNEVLKQSREISKSIGGIITLNESDAN